MIYIPPFPPNKVCILDFNNLVYSVKEKKIQSLDIYFKSYYIYQ